MTIIDSLNEYYLTAINTIIEQKLATLRFDRTFDGRIVSKVPNGYIVGIEGRERQVNATGNYSNGTTVRVHVPQNNWNKAYID